MKAIGKNLIIKKQKEGTTKTKGGLLLAENHREDIRYVEAVLAKAIAYILIVTQGIK